MRVFIENEAGSRRKNIYDERSLTYLRTVEVSRPYPFPYGFVVGTRSGDGGCIDCFVLTSSAILSGSTVECDPIGLLELIDTGETDHKVLAVRQGEPFVLDDTVLTTLKQFISGVFAHVPDKRMQIGRLLSQQEADAYVRGSCQNDATNPPLDR